MTRKPTTAKRNQTRSSRTMAETTKVEFSPLDVSGSPENALQLGFVDLGSDSRPESKKPYPLLSASHAALEQKPIPTTNFKRLHLDLLSFYNDNMPDFLGGKKEGLFKISINTRDPQNLTHSENDVTLAIDFKVKDGQYAPGFLHKGIYRNVIFSEWINLKFDLYELDTDADVYFDKVKSVIDSVPEMKNLDVLKGIPYLNLATKLFEGIIKTFGKNADDRLWGEIPILEITPTIGGAFLRSGIYIIFQRVNSKKEEVSFDNLLYRDNRLEINNGSIKRLPNHLILTVALQNHQS
ncbi:MAG TPA: hypothetical protein VGN63_18830 [Flavisolibacter sp.]|nr:hypothetical protein [Flavisolibacter sp.]